MEGFFGIALKQKMGLQENASRCIRRSRKWNKQVRRLNFMDEKLLVELLPEELEVERETLVPT